jgi:hypothetical protein
LLIVPEVAVLLKEGFGKEGVHYHFGNMEKMRTVASYVRGEAPVGFGDIGWT